MSLPLDVQIVQDEQLRRVARHEAGHFVVAMRLGHVLDYVDIREVGDRLGVAVTSAGPALGNDRHRIRESAVVFLAGPAAEGRDIDSSTGSCTDGDAFSAKVLISQLSGEDSLALDRLLEEVQQAADAYVKAWAEDIERLTSALLDRFVLTGQEVMDLLDVHC